MEISKTVMKKYASHYPPAHRTTGMYYSLMQLYSVDSRFGKGLYGGLWGKLSWRGSGENH